MTTMPKRHKDKQWLYDQYWREGEYIGGVAEAAGCSRATIRRNMNAFGIPTRNGLTEPDHFALVMRPKSWWYEKYWGEGKTTTELADELSTSHATVRKILMEKGIPRLEGGSNHDAYVFTRRPREWLFNQYWREQKSVTEIAKENGVDPSFISAVMAQHDPPIKMDQEFTSSGYRSGTANKIATRRVTDRGYVVHNVGMGGGKDARVSEHRMTAIAEWGLDAVAGKHVHHANDIKWLNVPVFDMNIPELGNPNLVPVDPITHAKL